MSLPGFTAEKSVGATAFDYVSGSGAGGTKGDVQMMGFLSGLVGSVGGAIGGKTGCIVREAGPIALKCLPCKTSLRCWARCVGVKRAKQLAACF